MWGYMKTIVFFVVLRHCSEDFVFMKNTRFSTSC